MLDGTVSISTHRSDFGARAARAGLWGLMALVVVCVLGLVLHEGRGVAPTQKQTVAPSGAGAGGFASVFIQRWLPAGEGSESDLQPFMSTVPTLTAKANIRFAAQTPVVLSSDEVRSGYWSVLLAVNEVAKDRAGKLQPAGTHWYRVPVAEAGTTGTGPGSNDTIVWQVTSAPYEVPAPTSAEALTNSVYSDAGVSTTGPIGDTSQRFLDAYLTGQGELARYTSPDVSIAPVTPPSATKVTVSSIAAKPVDGDAQNATEVPPDGTTVHVLVHATVVGSGGATIPMDYPLTLRSRDGRWEVLSLDPAPSTERRTSEPGRQTPDATDSQPSGSAVPTP
ncbi:MAG: hypothetical protein GEV10_25620 [Streptosporangiales bacterium]|nr:hypothetical protein [Streptosporangiales bacterium]